MDKTPTIQYASDDPVKQREGTFFSSMAKIIRAARNDALAARSRRVVLMLAFIWIVSLSDLEMTLRAKQIGGFEEANPIARQIIDYPHLVVAYKFLLLVSASGVIFFLRRKRLTEIGCWFLCLIYTLLALAWAFYCRSL